MNNLFDYAKEDNEEKSDKNKTISILPYYDDELEEVFCLLYFIG